MQSGRGHVFFVIKEKISGVKFGQYENGLIFFLKNTATFKLITYFFYQSFAVPKFPTSSL